MAEVQQADHEYVNSTTEANKKTMEAMMKIMLEQQSQLTLIMEKFTLVQGKGTSERPALTSVEKCPRCKKKAHKGGESVCWDD